VELGLQRVIILEDDLDFEENFHMSFLQVIEEADTVVPSWELMYVLKLTPNYRQIRFKFLFFLNSLDTLGGNKCIVMKMSLLCLVQTNWCFLAIHIGHWHTL
jgi:hypothetical protein